MSAGEDGRIVVDTTRADKLVWLMRCPPLVSRSWQSATTSAAADPTVPPPIIAKVILSHEFFPKDPEKSLQFRMELAQNDSGNAPKSYTLHMGKTSKDFTPMTVISESNTGKFSVEGKVEQKFDMEPDSENLGGYGKLCRERTTKSMIKTRQVQVIDNDHGGLMRPLPGMVGLTSSGSKEKRKLAPTKPSDLKRTRRDRQELENIIFKLFERQPNWALKQLVIETNQPEQFLKEILNDLCVYNKRGPNQGTHELKPEYKKTSEETDAA